MMKKNANAKNEKKKMENKREEITPNTKYYRSIKCVKNWYRIRRAHLRFEQHSQLNEKSKNKNKEKKEKNIHCRPNAMPMFD